MVRAFSFDDPDHDRQLESPRTGARGIEQQHAVDDFVARLVTVAEYDDVDVFGEQLGSKDVREKNSPAANFHASDLVAVGIIVVAEDEGDRRDLAQRFDDMLAADIAGMQNRIDALQRRKRFGTNQAVRIRDDADTRLNPRSTPSSPRSSLCIDL